MKQEGLPRPLTALLIVALSLPMATDAHGTHETLPEALHVLEPLGQASDDAANLQADCSRPKSRLQRVAASIGVRFGDGLEPAVVAEAVEMWNACTKAGHELPPLLAGKAGEINLVVHYSNRTVTASLCGKISGPMIKIYSWTPDENGRAFHCGSLAGNLAHEIGHYLGLEHAPARSACEDHIMAHISRNNRTSRRVDDGACQAVSRLWRLPQDRGEAFQILEGHNGLSRQR